MSSSPAFTKYVHNLLKAVSRSSITPLVDYTVLSCTIRPRRVRETFPPHCRPILTAPRIFELLMAFDALRLRNIIQLIGIFSMVFSHTPPKALTNVPDCIVFHGALIVFAALQVHETRTALVTGGTDYWVSYHRFVKFPNSSSHVSQNSGGPNSLWTKVLPFLIVVPCVIAAGWIAMAWWIRELYFEFGYVQDFPFLQLLHVHHLILAGRSSMSLVPTRHSRVSLSSRLLP